MRLKSKEVTVVTICYNEFDTIEGTIKSVINQTYKDFEYIVIDSDSTDGTLDIINKYRNQIDIVVSEKDDGIYDAMNKGIKISHGEYLYFINGGDCLYNENVLQDIFKEDAVVDLLYGDLVICHQDGKSQRLRQRRSVGYMKFVTGTIPHPASLVKRSIFKEYGVFDTNFNISADYEFFLRVFNKGVSIRYLPFVLARFDTSGVSSNPETFAKRQLERKTIQRKHLPLHFYYLARVHHFFVKNQNYFANRLILRLSSKVYRLLFESD